VLGEGFEITFKMSSSSGISPHDVYNSDCHHLSDACLRSLTH